MEQTLINNPNLKVRLRTGTEGPRHDPYAFEELTVETPRGTTVLRAGLGVTLRHDGAEIDVVNATADERERMLRNEVFQKLTGHTVDALRDAAERKQGRCRSCGNRRNFRSAPGYPGEHFTLCGRCGDVVDSYFCESEIM